MRLAVAIAVALGSWAGLADAEVVAQARVGPGEYRPLDAPDPDAAAIPVSEFLLDVTPVTNAQYLAFVVAQPDWRRDSVPGLFADERYLSHWKAPDELGPTVLPHAPVTSVSWFAADAYCQHRGARLPSMAEWEVAAAADEQRKDASADPAFRRRILDWYSTPTRAPRRVGTGPANAWGIRDLHGLTWEWVEDFQAVLGAGDSRDGQEPDRRLICGMGGLAGGEKVDYAAFMRLAMRASLEGRSTTAALSFRCASDLESTTAEDGR